MTKLYQKTEAPSHVVSFEAFADYYQSAKVISNEAVSDYLFKIKDSLVATTAVLFNQHEDISTEDLLRNRHEVLHVVKRIKFVELMDQAVSKPENFKGRYLEFIRLLNNEGNDQFTNAMQAVSTLNLAAAAFINDYREDGVMTLYGNNKFKETSKITNKTKADVTKYFPKNDKSVRSRVGDVIASLGEIDTLYTDFTYNDKVLNISRIDELRKATETTTSLIDTLIEQNAKTQLFSKNESVKRDLIAAIQVTAEAVEFFSYLYSNAILLRTAFKSLTETILKFGDTNSQV